MAKLLETIQHTIRSTTPSQHQILYADYLPRTDVTPTMFIVFVVSWNHQSIIMRFFLAIEAN